MSLYTEKLKDPRWQKKRLEILNRDEWKCSVCNDEKTELMVHHKEYDKNKEPWEYDNDFLTTLCVNCHESEHGLLDSFRIKDRINPLIDHFEESVGGNISGISSGYANLDRILGGGFQPGELIILAARPSMGKTTLTYNISRNVALILNVPVAIFSFESPSELIVNRMVCSEARVEFSRVNQGVISQEDWQNITDAAEVVENIPIYIDSSNELSLNTIERRIERLKTEKNIGIALIDNLQFFTTKKFEYPEILRRLKILSKENQIPIILLSQVDPKLENRSDKRPMLRDLYGTEVDSFSDVIMFLYRDEIYNKEPDNPRKGMAEIIIGKNRNGPIGSSNMLFLQKYLRFEEMTQDFIQEFE